MQSPNPTITNINNLISECDNYISTIEKYRDKSPMASGAIDKAIGEINSLKADWISKKDRMINKGLDDEGEYSYATISYKASYAFVILANILKEFRFEIEKLGFADYDKFI